jgi:hypothetical protein
MGSKQLLKSLFLTFLLFTFGICPTRSTKAEQRNNNCNPDLSNVEFITFDHPKNGDKFKLGRIVIFQGKANGCIQKVKLIADKKWTIGNSIVNNGNWSISNQFYNPGNRKFVVEGFNRENQKIASTEVKIILQPLKGY